MSALRIRILVDNRAAEGLAAEHGFSAWIERDGKTVLFDTGQGDALEKNIRRMELSLLHLDALVLSHGHYDHTGAVDFVLEENPELQVYAHPAVLKTRYSLHPGQPPKDISMSPEERLMLENLPDAQLRWITVPTEIVPGVWLSGPIPRTHPLEDTGGPFFDDPEGKTPDLIKDDMALWIETPKGLLVICGCCHAGLINTLNHISAASGGQKVWGIMGGLHLKAASSERLEATANALRRLDPELLVPCHCTGEKAIEYFRQHFPAKIQSGEAGYELKQEYNHE